MTSTSTTTTLFDESDTAIRQAVDTLTLILMSVEAIKHSHKSKSSMTDNHGWRRFHANSENLAALTSRAEWASACKHFDQCLNQLIATVPIREWPKADLWLSSDGQVMKMTHPRFTAATTKMPVPVPVFNAKSSCDPTTTNTCNAFPPWTFALWKERNGSGSIGSESSGIPVVVLRHKTVHNRERPQVAVVEVKAMADASRLSYVCPVPGRQVSIDRLLPHPNHPHRGLDAQQYAEALLALVRIHWNTPITHNAVSPQTAAQFSVKSAAFTLLTQWDVDAGQLDALRQQAVTPARHRQTPPASSCLHTISRAKRTASAMNIPIPAMPPLPHSHFVTNLTWNRPWRDSYNSVPLAKRIKYSSCMLSGSPVASSSTTGRGIRTLSASDQ